MSLSRVTCQCYLIQIAKWLLIFSTFIFLVHPGRFAVPNYPSIKQEDIEKHLVEFQHENNSCNFSIKKSDDFLLYPNWSEEADLESVDNGQWSPKHCKARYKTTIIVPYRDRQEQLDTFLNFMHSFLQKQLLDYRIVIVEQVSDTPFNRAKLFNVGFVESLKISPSSNCFVFHDVDLLPQKLSNTYACTNDPRHMSASVNTFRYNLPYLGLFGGAVSIMRAQFEKVNGFSNVFYGWGGEDDDFLNRIESHEMKICRFEPNVARYYMLSHRKEAPSQSRLEMLHSGSNRFESDGLNSLSYKLKKMSYKKLYTWYLVDV